MSAKSTFNSQMVFSGSVYQANLTFSPTPDATYFTTASNSVTVLKAGTYDIHARTNVQFVSEMRVRKNGVDLSGFSASVDGQSGSADAAVPTTSTSSLVSLAANDVLSVWIRNGSGSFGGTSTSFEVVFVPTPTNPR